MGQIGTSSGRRPPLSDDHATHAMGEAFDAAFCQALKDNHLSELVREMIAEWIHPRRDAGRARP